MRRFITGLCYVIVGLQVLVGVPLAVCLLVGCYLGGEVLGPLAVEFRVTAGAEQPDSQSLVDSPQEASAEPAAENDAILEAREERGSLLAGTLLNAGVSPAEEQQEFVAAFRHVATGDSPGCPVNGPTLAPANPLPQLPVLTTALALPLAASRSSADGFAIEHLYLMADLDEQTGLYDRADQWRALARGIRRESPAVSEVHSACELRSACGVQSVGEVQCPAASECAWSGELP